MCVWFVCGCLFVVCLLCDVCVFCEFVGVCVVWVE